MTLMPEILTKPTSLAPCPDLTMAARAANDPARPNAVPRRRVGSIVIASHNEAEGLTHKLAGIVDKTARLGGRTEKLPGGAVRPNRYTSLAARLSGARSFVLPASVAAALLAWALPEWSGTGSDTHGSAGFMVLAALVMVMQLVSVHAIFRQARKRDAETRLQFASLRREIAARASCRHDGQRQ